MKTNYIAVDSSLPVVLKDMLLDGLEKKGIRFENNIRGEISITLAEVLALHVAKNGFTMGVRCEATSCELKSNKPEACRACHHNLDIPKEIDCEVGTCDTYINDREYCRTTCHYNRAKKQK